MEIDKDRFVELVAELSGENFFKCYQCGRCTAGCPLAEYMDAPPSKILRMLQYRDEDITKVESPWVCASCIVCSVRCPRGVDIAAIMEALRQVKQRYMPDEIKYSPKVSHDMPQIAMVASFRKYGRW